MGINVSKDFMVKTLLSLGCIIDENDMIAPPSWRADLEHKADIAEEVARFFGYNKIPVTSIKGGVYGVVTDEQKLERLTVSTLLAQGMSEVCTYTFVSPKVFDKIRLPADSPMRRTVNILNPLGEDTGVMRTCVYPSMLEVLSRNYNNRNATASLFEVAKEFTPKETPDLLPEEKLVISLGMYGENYDFYSLKGITEELFEVFGITDYDVEAVRDNPTFHPGRCAKISKNGKLLGVIGEAHPLVLSNFNMPVRAFIGRIELAALFELSSVGTKTYHSLPRFPASTRDIALLCDDVLPVLTIEKAIKKAVGEILENIALFDFYKGEQIPAGKKSLAFSVAMRASNRTLTDQEVNTAMDKALKAVSSLGCELRG